MVDFRRHSKLLNFLANQIWYKAVSKFLRSFYSPDCSPLLQFFDCFQQQYLRRATKNAWVYFPPSTGAFLIVTICLAITYNEISVKMEKEGFVLSFSQIIQNQLFLKQKSITRNRMMDWWWSGWSGHHERDLNFFDWQLNIEFGPGVRLRLDTSQ